MATTNSPTILFYLSITFRLPGPNGAASNEQGLSLYGTLTQAQNLPTNQINPGKYSIYTYVM